MSANEYKGMKFFIRDNFSQSLFTKIPFKNDFNYLQDYINSNYPGQEFGFIKLFDRLRSITLIKSEENFLEALDHITGQGLHIFIKKSIVREGDWRCTRCQRQNKPDITICVVCKFKK
jgi:hypothetical protein